MNSHEQNPMYSTVLSPVHLQMVAIETAGVLQLVIVKSI